MIHLRATNPDDPRTYIQQWSLGIQRELPYGFFVEADYVGSKGSHILSLGDLNQFVNNGTNVILNSSNQPTLPYPGFGLIEYSQNNAYLGVMRANHKAIFDTLVKELETVQNKTMTVAKTRNPDGVYSDTASPEDGSKVHTKDYKMESLTRDRGDEE